MIQDKFGKYLRLYSNQVKQLENYFFKPTDENLRNKPELTKKINHLLNGGVSSMLRDTIPSIVRKTNGIYFTPKAISKKVADQIEVKKSNHFRIIDPCMGSGDLLLGCARKLLKGENEFHNNIEFLSKKLLGFDLYEPFISLAKIRFIILVAKFSQDLNQLENFYTAYKRLNNFVVNNSLEIMEDYRESDIIVINPPYIKIDYSQTLSWTKGKTQLAAIFIDKIIEKADTGTQIIAILPDVLRSGTNFEKWRNHILGNNVILNSKIIGRFDEHTDVDVFLLHLKVNKKLRTQVSFFQRNNNQNSLRVGDLFNIKVGAVVPFRNKDSKKKCLYLTCKEASWWGITKKFSKTKFDGTLFNPPFIAVRRTSSPSEKYRAYATIVREGKEIAVENHLIILTPMDKKLKTCKMLLNNLQNVKTNKWLNKTIRCRHLTVSSLKDIPFWN